MSASALPGTNAARYGPGNRLVAMDAAHAAFRRDLQRLAGAATAANLREPARRESVMNGWRMFTGQLHLHHGAEDRFIWPRLRRRLATSPAALSTLAAMEAEHSLLDPLLAAVDDRFARPDPGDVSAVLDELIMKLSAHLRHEERDAMPMIGEALSDREWRAVVGEIHTMARSLRVLSVADFVPWLTDGVPRGQAKVIATILPPPLRLVHRWVWQPRYRRVSRW